MVYRVVADFGYGSRKSRIRPFSEIRQSPAKSGSGQISNRICRIWRLQVQLQYVQLVRPPVRSYILPVKFLFLRHAFSEVLRPIALTLPHDRNLAEFDNASLKIRGALTWKILVDFLQHQTLIANNSRTRQQIQHRKTLQTGQLPLRLIKKGRWTFSPLTTWNYMWVFLSP